MSAEHSTISHVSDTALLVASARAIESERPDAFFRDPFAKRLAGERGLAMFGAIPHPVIMGFGIAIRTWFIDELIIGVIASANLETVLCLGSGLDTRPWRLDLPPDLRWIEVDFAPMLDYKESHMAGEEPRCRRERLSADVNDPVQRAAVYAAVGRSSTLVVSEGLLMYLPADTVRTLASEAAENIHLTHWIADITTTDFTNAIGGDIRHVRHVQADDHLKGEQILEAFKQGGWKTDARRSYITDLAFAKDRIAKMMSKQTQPPKQPAFASEDPSGVHLLTHS